MSFGICSLSIVPCRKEPSSTSEMVTQLLFGETYTVVEDLVDWLSVVTTYDNYPCWISAKQHTPLSGKNMKALTTDLLSSELIQVIHNTGSQSVFPITIGATLPGFKDNRLSTGEINFSFEGQTTDSKQKKSTKELIDTAYLFLNAPYLWGGRSAWGLDCSGLSQLFYAYQGILIPRDADQQEHTFQGIAVSEVRVGDLVFFNQHVAICLGLNASGKMHLLHANARHMCVTIDTLGEGAYGETLERKLRGFGRWNS